MLPNLAGLKVGEPTGPPAVKRTMEEIWAAAFGDGGGASGGASGGAPAVAPAAAGPAAKRPAGARPGAAVQELANRLSRFRESDGRRQEVCPTPAADVPPELQPLDEGSSGPVFPADSVEFVTVPQIPHVPNDASAPPAAAGLPMIKARYVLGEQSVYAQTNPGDAEGLRRGGEWCPTTVSQALSKREARANPRKYFARPEQLYPINDAKSMGVAVYKVLDNADKINGEVAQWRASLAASVNAAPEFEPVQGAVSLFERQDIKLAVGGFAALAHPSSFHNEFARALRFRAEKYVVENDIFGLDAGGVNAGKKLEQVVDRTMIRRPGQTPTAEAWHRDIARGTLDGDEVFGGWINLDPQNDQYFSCVPGSAHDRPTAGVDYESGFAKIGKSTHPSIISRSYRIVIPPGHMMVFNERTIHEVAPVTCENRSSCRLFFGWRLTRGTTPLFYDLERRLTEQDGMPLKSGQHKHAYSDPSCGGRYKEMRDFDSALLFDSATNTLGFKNYPGGPPMYPSAYWGQQDPEKPEKFCANLRPCLLKMRYFNPSVYVRDAAGNVVLDKEGKPKTRSAKSNDLESELRGTRFLERRKKPQAGVLCNFDLKWNDGQNGQRTQWSYGIKEPLKPDTVRSLTETARLLRADPAGGRVQWAQPAYAPHEIEILKPHTLEELRAIVSAHPDRALPVLAFQAAERAADTPGM